MTNFQKAVKYIATGFAIFLAVSIICGILSVLAIITGIHEGDAVNESITGYSVSSSVTNLEVDISAADFTIKKGDTFAVESNLKNLTVTEKNGTLRLHEKNNFGFIYDGALLILYVPEDITFEKAKITTGAGKFTVDGMTTENLVLTLGAGDVEIKDLISTGRVDIDGGAGRITIDNGSFENLDLDMGVGQLNFCASVLGSSEFNLGVGESNLTFLGKEEDYSLDIDKGIGNVTVNGKTVSEYETQSGKLGSIEIDGGVGSVDVNFK